ncbi:MAG: purine-nucleoside phosphorylase [Angustibacter sp.]
MEPSDLTDPDADPHAVAREAAHQFAALSGVARHDIALVLGSGWAAAGDLLGETTAEVLSTRLPGFAPPGVSGHRGVVRSVRIAPPAPSSSSLPSSTALEQPSAAGGGRHSPADTTRQALVFGTRTHVYEGHGVRAVVHAVRTAAAAGCRTVVLTNGCGGLNPAWPPGTPVLISDHINLTGASPIEGARFVDLTDLYSPRLRALCREVQPDLPEGVYVQFRGPHYETPAEVRMAGILGGHLVGMSTALEAIAAREAGMEVLGISLVTNPAAGLGGPLDHSEVLATGQTAAQRCGQLLAEAVGRLGPADG